MEQTPLLLTQLYAHPDLPPRAGEDWQGPPWFVQAPGWIKTEIDHDFYQNKAQNKGSKL